MSDGPTPSDPRFSLPACDDPPTTEIGVVIMGLPAKQLLAGLGMAVLADDPAAVTLLIDQVRHGGAAQVTLGHLVATGLERWRAVRPVLAAAGAVNQRTASLRRGWAWTYGALGRCELGAMSTAAAVYLTACWLRAVEIDEYADAAAQ
ncbi:MAG TPA: DUF6187 family protein [Streptosporangiaceae bacterium]